MPGASPHYSSQSITLIKALPTLREEILLRARRGSVAPIRTAPCAMGAFARRARPSPGIRRASRQIDRGGIAQLNNRNGVGKGDASMATIDVATNSLSRSDHRTQLRRAVVASTVGTTIEWYDFLLYSTVTGLIFGKLFFPKSDPLVGVLEAFAIYTVGFIARPIGAAIFGNYGDRIGRKGALIATLLLTELATAAVGLVPTYDQIGIWGAVILTIIRFIQGVGVGGEWGGSVLLAMEWARTNAHRGFITS